MDKKRTQFGNKSIKKLKSNLKCSGNFEKEGDLAPEGSRIEQKAFLQKKLKKIKWNKKREEYLYGIYGQGLVITFYQKKKFINK